MTNLPQKQVTTVGNYLNQAQVRKHLENMLKDRAGQFITSLVSLSNLTPGLAKCDPKTLLYCGLKATSLNLPLDNNLGFAYAIPYKRKEQIDGKWYEFPEAQFQMGYRGFVQLAQRTGQYKTINVIDVRAGELEGWDLLTEQLALVLIDDVEKREKQPVIGYAAVFELVNGFKKVSYWTRARVEAHGKRFSKTFNNGPWKSDFDAMAKKTVLKDLLSKWGPLSTEMQEAVKYDQSVIREKDGEEVPEYIDADFNVAEEISTDDELAKEFEQQKDSGQLSLGGEGK